MQLFNKQIGFSTRSHRNAGFDERPTSQHNYRGSNFFQY